ncbi:MAG: AbrB family transcriptional regulator [Pseudotabrizicola sp.]|uniref:AbrB family transcriptional regulator n=1 Tax=Pseudotabrizicola sp. TaxID=2939647 RepID=UPI0027178391|nr:AbrB family transcriptional regulator [Pseudotabrizicola sp.]MDO9638941.1 AbrB family transcriptional regulator [Pseudotabrizicola sp.]
MVDLRVDIPALALTLAIGAAGGMLAAALGLPLGYLLGSLLAVGVTAAMGWRPLGRAVTMPMRLRMAFVPVIGVAIGGAFTPQVAREALGWGPSLLALLVFVPVAHGLGYVIFRRGGLAQVDAFFCALPGGLIESVQLGEEAGADVRLLTVMQFLRLILTIIAVPLIFLGVTGHSVGSASGVQMTGADVALSLRDVLVLLVCGGVGVWLARLCRIPAWIITGPLILSALAHGLGWVEDVPPGWLISLTQVVLGTGLGARFAGVTGAMLRRAGLLAVLNGAAVMALAFGFALALHALVGEPVAAVFLAFAPGGLAEMSLIALSLNISAIYVTAHHVVRIAMAVFAAQIGARWFLKR